MAKYIEEQEILWRMNNAFDEQDTYLPIHFKEMVIDECNTADVIARSKVDKAIKEIEEQEELSHADFNQFATDNGLDAEYNDYHFEGMKTALNIFKRNLEDTDFKVSGSPNIKLQEKEKYN